MKWLLRLLLFRVLGKRAVAVLGVLGVLTALRSARSQDERDLQARPQPPRA